MNLTQSLTMLRLVCGGLLIFAAIWFTAAFNAIDAPASLLLDLNDWPIDGGHQVFSRDARWLSAVGAGLLTWIALQLLTIIIPRLEAQDAQTWRGAVLSILAWYVIDTTGSVAAGVTSNVVVNTGFLILLMVPLWAAKPHIQSSNNIFKA